MADNGRRRRKGRRKRGSGNQQADKTPAVVVRPLYTPADDPSRTYMPPRPPVREYDPDPISGKPIQNPLTAIAHPSSGKPMNIETVVDLLVQQEQPAENQEIAYIGAGSFGVLNKKNVQGRQVFDLVKKITYEDTHEKYPWRRELSPGISRDYIPQPEPLDRLYTQEELQGFPRLGASTAAYLPKSG